MFLEKVSPSYIKNNYDLTPWPQFASELYQLSDRHLSAKLMPTFCG
jgi:hypothetical protein